MRDEYQRHRLAAGNGAAGDIDRVGLGAEGEGQRPVGERVVTLGLDGERQADRGRRDTVDGEARGTTDQVKAGDAAARSDPAGQVDAVEGE